VVYVPIEGLKNINQKIIIVYCSSGDHWCHRIFKISGT